MQTAILPLYALSAPLEALLLPATACSALPSLSFVFDVSTFLIQSFPANASPLPVVNSQQQQVYDGLWVQVRRAINGLKPVDAASLVMTVSKARSKIAVAQEVCAELLESVRIMQETELVPAAQQRQQLTPNERLALLETHLVQAIRSSRTLDLYMLVLDSLPLLLEQDDVIALKRALDCVIEIQQVQLAACQQAPIMETLKEIWTQRLQLIISYLLRHVHRHLPSYNPTHQENEQVFASLSASLSMIHRHASPRTAHELCLWFARIRVLPYQMRCQDSQSFTTLAQLSDAYKWLYVENSDYLLNSFPTLFPSAWCCDAYIVKRFVELTQQHLCSLLVDLYERQEHRLDLYAPLTATLEFERFLKDNVVPPTDPLHSVVDANSATVLAAAVSSSLPASTSSNSSSSPALFQLSGVLSSCFHPYLDTFVVNEQELLSSQIQRLLQEERWGINDETVFESPTYHYASSDALIAAIAQSMDRLRPLVPDQIMYLLFKQYQRALVDYLRATESKVPSASVVAPSTSTTSPALLLSAVSLSAAQTQAQLSLGRGDMNLMIAIVLNAEYVSENIRSLPQRLRIVEADYLAHLHFDDVQERVNKIRVKAANALVAALQAKCEMHLQGVKDVKRDVLSNGGEESLYMKSLQAAIKRDLPRLQRLRDYPLILSAFLNRLVPAIFSALKKLKSVNEVMAQQLLLDVKRIRNYLVALPQVTADPAAVISAPFPPPLETKAEKMERKAAAALRQQQQDEQGKTPAATSATSPAPSEGAEQRTEEIKPQAAGDASTITMSPRETSVTSPGASKSEVASWAHNTTSSTSTASSSSAPSLTPSLITAVTSPAVAPDSLLALIDSYLIPLARSFIVLSAPPDKFIATFRSQWPKRHSDLCVELMETKGIQSKDQEKAIKLWNSAFREGHVKRIDYLQKSVLLNMFSDARKTLQQM